MQLIKIFYSVVVVGGILSGAALMPPNIAKTQGISVPALPTPVPDSLSTPALVDELGEKAAELKERSKAIGNNARSNEREASKLQKEVNKLSVVQRGQLKRSMDTSDIIVQDTPAPRPNFFQRMNWHFWRKK